MADHKDDKDYIKGWTVQQGAAPEAPEEVPGNVVLPEELPYQVALLQAGIDPDQYHAGLVVAADDEERRAMRHEDERLGLPERALNADGEVVTAPKSESPAKGKVGEPDAASTETKDKPNGVGGGRAASAKDADKK